MIRKYRHIENLICCLLLLSFLLSGACHTEGRLEYSLAFAGDNRPELEKVLAHYKEQPEKLAAARFLIENMPRWYGYAGAELDSILPVLAEGAKNYFIPEEIVRKWKNFSFYSLPKVYDSQVITAPYLIENIDLAFEVREKYPWCRRLDFRDFCEWVLPYRIGDEPLSDWRQTYYDCYGALLDSAYRGNDGVEACRLIAGELKKANYHYNTSFRLPRLSARFLFDHRIGYCREACDLTLYAMRACGIPVAIDQFVYSPEYQHSHMWCVVRDTTGRCLPFWFTQYEARRDMKDDGRKKGKVYRSCFGWQEEPFPGITADEAVPTLFRDRFVREVTANYTGENRVVVPLQYAPGPYVYLGLFSPQGWVPVDMARNGNGQAVFRNLEEEIIYQPLYREGKTCLPAGYPFLFTGGKALLLEPDLERRTEAVLKRKMPLIRTIREFLYNNMIGARVEGADNPAFRHARLLYEVTDTLDTNWLEVALRQPARYRYVRYVSPAGRRVELAGLSLYGDSAATVPFPMSLIHAPQPERNLDHLTDGDILTYYGSKDTSCYLGFDLGKAQTIRKIVINPRNDDNFIWPGHRYELFYQDGAQGWKSLGIRVAEGRELRYEVPENALLWLRDLTKGKEEQVFLYRNGRPYFVFDIRGGFVE